MDEKTGENEQAATAQFMTTEHFTLQTAKTATVAEANGRVSLYIGAVSSAVVALAFIGQVSGMSEAFFVFALVLFPSLLFLGIVTFERVLQTALEDWIYTHKIDRIRNYYAETSPEVKKYFNDSLYDNPFSDMRGVIIKGEIWQYFLTGSGMVGVINSILAGVFTGMVCKIGILMHVIGCAAFGIMIFAVSVFIHYRRQISQFTKIGERIKAVLTDDSRSKK